MVNTQHYVLNFRITAVEVSRLKMVSNEFNSLRKNFDDKIMTFLFSVANVRSLPHEVKM